MPQFQYEELHAGPKQQLLGHRLQFFTSAIWAAESQYKDSKGVSIKTVKSNRCTATLRILAEKMTMCILPMNWEWWWEYSVHVNSIGMVCNRLTLITVINMKEDHRSYRRNFYSCEKKAWKNSGLYGIRTLDFFSHILR